MKVRMKVVTGAKADASSLAASVLLRGLLSARPAAAAANANLYYFVSDVDGGTLYQSDGAAWIKLAGGTNTATDAKYVDVAGDTMTGDLTVPRIDVGPVGGHLAMAGNFLQLVSDGGSVLWMGDALEGNLAFLRTNFGLFQTTAGATMLAYNTTGIAFNGNVGIAKAAAIASPAADVTALKTAVDAIRAALTNIGITA